MANQYSPWQEAGMAFESMGDSANRTMLGLAQLRYHQQMALRQQAYQQQQMQIQEALKNAEVQHYQQQVASQKLKDMQMQQSAARAQNVGQAGMLASGLMTPSLANEQGTLQNSVGFLRQQGVLPDDAVTVSRGDLANLLRAAQQAMTQTEAVSTLSSAASMLTPSNVSRGGTAIDRFGNVVGRGLPPAPPEPYAFTAGGVGNKVSGQFQPYPPNVMQALHPGSSGVDTLHPGTMYSPPYYVVPSQHSVYPIETQDGTNNIPPRFGKPLTVPGFGPPAPTLRGQPTLEHPNSQQEYDALPSGSVYVDTDGQVKRKK